MLLATWSILTHNEIGIELLGGIRWSMCRLVDNRSRGLWCILWSDRCRCLRLGPDSTYRPRLRLAIRGCPGGVAWRNRLRTIAVRLRALAHECRARWVRSSQVTRDPYVEARSS